MAIAGKPGLYKLIAQAKNGIVVESIVDQKRMQAFSHDKVSTLEEISIYTESGDMPLKDVLREMYRKLNGQPAPENKGDNNKIKQFFSEVLPDYDKDRVYVSHMQKVISWYNMLLQYNLIDLEEESTETTDEGVTTKADESDITEENHKAKKTEKADQADKTEKADQADKTEEADQA